MKDYPPTDYSSPVRLEQKKPVALAILDEIENNIRVLRVEFEFLLSEQSKTHKIREILK